MSTGPRLILSPETVHAAAPRLDSVVLYHADPASLEALAGCAELERLEVVGSDTDLIDDATVRAIAARHPRLRWLRLSRCPAVTDDGLRALEQLPRLRRLSIGGCPRLSARGLRSVAKKLESLQLVALEELRLGSLSELDLPSLTALSIRPTQLSASELDTLSGLPAIARLNLVLPHGLRIDPPIARALDRNLRDGVQLRVGRAHRDEVEVLAEELGPDIEVALSFARYGAEDRDGLETITPRVLEAAVEIEGLLSLDLRGWSVRGLSSLKYASALRVLSIFGDRPGLSNAAIRSVAGLELERLDAGAQTRSNMDAAVLAPLSKMSSLRELGISRVPVTDRSLRHLRRLPLRSLDYGDPTMQAGALGMAHVGAVGTLERLTVSAAGRNGTGPAGVCALGGMRGLRRLSVRTDALDTSMFEILASLPRLAELSLDSSEPFTDAHLLALAKAPALEALELRYFAATPEVTWAGIGALARHPRLRILNYESQPRPPALERARALGTCFIPPAGHGYHLLQPHEHRWRWPLSWS